MTTYYFGWESLCEYCFEDPNYYGRESASAAYSGFARLKSATLTVSESVDHHSNIGDARYRKRATYWKGIHTPTATVTMELPDALGTTAYDIWFLKLGLDAFNVAHSGTAWVIPNTGTSAYGSNNLASFSMNLGHNKSGNIRCHHVSGCMVNSSTLSLAKGETVKYTAEIVAKIAYLNQTTYTNGSATRSTSAPLAWHNCNIEFGNDGSPVVVQDFTALDITVANNLTPNPDLAESYFGVNNCNTAGDWTEGGDGSTPSANTSVYKEGASAISLGKDTTTGTDINFDATENAIDMSNKKLHVWVYVADAASLTTLATAASDAVITLGTGGYTNINGYNIGGELAVGWYEHIIDVESEDSSSGTGADLTLIDRLRIKFATDSATDTLTDGKIVMDHWHISTPRTVRSFIPGIQEITGSFTINLTTTTGLTLYRDITGDTGDPLDPTGTSLTAKELRLTVQNEATPSTKNFIMDLRNLYLGDIAMDLDVTKVQEVTVPWVAQYYTFTITSVDATAITNFNDQS